MNIGPAEIIIVLVIALVVFGPNRLPRLARDLGRGVREFQRAASSARADLGLDDIAADVDEIKTNARGIIVDVDPRAAARKQEQATAGPAAGPAAPKAPEPPAS